MCHRNKAFTFDLAELSNRNLQFSVPRKNLIRLEILKMNLIDVKRSQDAVALSVPIDILLKLALFVTFKSSIMFSRSADCPQQQKTIRIKLQYTHN